MRSLIQARGRRSRSAAVLSLAVLAMLALPAGAYAQPSNDNYSSATTITALAFSDTINIGGATPPNDTAPTRDSLASSSGVGAVL